MAGGAAVLSVSPHFSNPFGVLPLFCVSYSFAKIDQAVSLLSASHDPGLADEGMDEIRSQNRIPKKTPFFFLGSSFKGP